MRKPVWRKIKILTEIKAREIFEGVVKDFGTGSAHIPFSVHYLGHKVLVIPLDEVEKE